MTNRHRQLTLAGAAALLALSACDENTGGPAGNPGSYDHARAPGASAGDFLAGADFDRLVVQVQFVSGFIPSEGALAAGPELPQRPARERGE